MNDLPTQWIFLRGLSREARHWGEFPQQCRDQLGWTIRCLDLPGFGQQRHHRAALSIGKTVEQLRRQAAPLDGQRIGLLGLSLGGMAALHWAAQAPQDIDALVLINSSSADCPIHHRLRVGALPAMINSLGSRSVKRQEKAILAMVSNVHSNDPERLTQWCHIRQQASISRANVLRQLLAASRYRSPKPEMLQQLSGALVLSSRSDRMVSWRCSQFFADKYGWPLQLHNQAGHDLPLDAPDWIIQQLQLWGQIARPAHIANAPIA